MSSLTNEMERTKEDLHDSYIQAIEEGRLEEADAHLDLFYDYYGKDEAMRLQRAYNYDENGN